MPTARSYWFLFAAFVFWLFANQTQIGWLYSVAALLVGLVMAGGLLNRWSLGGIQMRRHITSTPTTLQRRTELPHLSYDETTFYENDEVTIALQLASVRRTPTVQLTLTETCPLADPNTPFYETRMFVPSLSAGETLQFTYTFPIDRRGVFTFPPVPLQSRAPFGFFQRRTQFNLATACLVFPELRSLRRLPLLDRQPAAQMTFPKAGIGSEVIGVRPFKTGDSPRHIHWRSVARTGRLISKEFAEETQPGLTLVLDRYSPYPTTSKHTPFELAIKCAVSIAEYALRRRYALYLAANSDDLALPVGALTWDVLMQYLARVPSQPRPTLPDLLAHFPMQQYAVVLIAEPDERVIEPLVTLKHRGVNVLAVLPDPASFPIESGKSAQGVAGSLQQAGVAVRLLAHGDDWSVVLSEREEPPKRV